MKNDKTVGKWYWHSNQYVGPGGRVYGEADEFSLEAMADLVIDDLTHLPPEECHSRVETAVRILLEGVPADTDAQLQARRLAEAIVKVDEDQDACPSTEFAPGRRVRHCPHCGDALCFNRSVRCDVVHEAYSVLAAVPVEPSSGPGFMDRLNLEVLHRMAKTAKDRLIAVEDQAEGHELRLQRITERLDALEAARDLKAEVQKPAVVDRLPSYAKATNVRCEPAFTTDCGYLGRHSGEPCWGKVVDRGYTVCAGHQRFTYVDIYTRTTDPRDESAARVLGVWGGK